MTNKMSRLIAVVVFGLFIASGVSFAQVSPPQNPVAAVDGNTVSLTWDKPASGTAVSYNIYRVFVNDPGPTMDVTKLNFTKAADTKEISYTDDVTPASDNSMKSGAVYYYITSVDANGEESSPSAYVKAELKEDKM